MKLNMSVFKYCLCLCRKEEIAKRQNEALKRLQEQQQQARVVKTTPAPWTAPDTAGASLADIQKTERKQVGLHYLFSNLRNKIHCTIVWKKKE